MGKTRKIEEKSGNFVSPEKWEPWLFSQNVIASGVEFYTQWLTWLFSKGGSFWKFYVLPQRMAETIDK